METNKSDNIIIRCKRGDRRAFALLMSEHQDMVFALALKMLADEREAEDTVQDVFVHVWQHISQYSPQKGSFAAWVYAVAAHMCIDKIRHNKPLSVKPDDETIFRRYASGSNPEQQLCNKEWAAIVKVLSSRLSPRQRVVFTLRMLENVPVEEITSITGITPEKIKSNLYVARKKIIEQLNKLGYGKE